MSDDKPRGRQAGWLRLGTDYPFIYHMYRIRRDHIRLPSGIETTYAYMESKGAVWVVPVTDDEKIVLIRQYRYAVDEWIW